MDNEGEGIQDAEDMEGEDMEPPNNKIIDSSDEEKIDIMSISSLDSSPQSRLPTSGWKRSRELHSTTSRSLSTSPPSA